MPLLRKVGEMLYVKRFNSVGIFLAAVCVSVAGCAATPEKKPDARPRPAAAARNPAPPWASAATAAAAPASRRIDDPIVMRGQAFPSLSQAPLDRMGLLRCEQRRFARIPFQIDERSPDGTFAFKNGPSAKRDVEPGFDANDELVFMARDTGERCLGAQLPAGAKTGVEIEVRDPANGASRWVYLFLFDTAAPVSDRDYVQADFSDEAEDWRISADSYVVGFAKNALFYKYVSVRKTDGGWTPNMVDRLKIRGSFSMFFNTLSFDFQAEELSKTKLMGWNDGPVRVLFHLTGHFEALIKIPIKADLIVQALPTYFIFPLHLELPVDLSTVVSKASLYGINDFSRHIYDYNVRFYDAHNPPQGNVAVDGVLSEEEWMLNYNDDRDWIALVGDGVAAFNRVYFPPDMRFVTKRLYLGENPEQADPPESEQGIVALGYDFEGVENLKKGAYTIYLHFYFPPGFQIGDEARILNITDRPLQPVSRPLKKQ